MIDTGLLVEPKVPQELWFVKDFASGLLVLQLVSAKTVHQILSLTLYDISSANTLIVTLFSRDYIYLQSIAKIISSMLEQE